MGVAWTRAVLVVSGRPFARALVAPTMAWLVPGAILFGGNGITARTAVSVLRSSPLAWAIVLFAFATLTTPAVAAAIHAKGTLTLRSLQGSVRPRAMMVPLACMLLLAQLPIVVLFARAGEPVAGVVQAISTLALELALVSAARTVGPLLPRRTPRARRPLLAIGAHYMRTLCRRDQAALSMGGTAMGLGAGAMWLSFTNDPPRDPLGRAMCVLAAPVCIVAGLLARALLQEEERLANLLRSARTKAWVSALAMLGVVCAPNAAYASAATHAVSARVPARSLGADVAAGVFGLALALLVALWARKHARSKRRDPATFVAGTIGIALAAIIMGVMW